VAALTDVQRWWQDDGEWVVVESGRARWRVLLPTAPHGAAAAGRYAEVGADAFDPWCPSRSLASAWEAKLSPAAGKARWLRKATRLAARLVRLLGRMSRRRRPGTQS
jgi:hypothetical protein